MTKFLLLLLCTLPGLASAQIAPFEFEVEASFGQGMRRVTDEDLILLSQKIERNIVDYQAALKASNVDTSAGSFVVRDVLVIGRTDPAGDEEFNLAFSQDRANGLVDELRALLPSHNLRIGNAAFTAEGIGETEAVAMCASAPEPVEPTCEPTSALSELDRNLPSVNHGVEPAAPSIAFERPTTQLSCAPAPVAPAMDCAARQRQASVFIGVEFVPTVATGAEDAPTAPAEPPAPAVPLEGELQLYGEEIKK